MLPPSQMVQISPGLDLGTHHRGKTALWPQETLSAGVTAGNISEYLGIQRVGALRGNSTVNIYTYNFLSKWADIP